MYSYSYYLHSKFAIDVAKRILRISRKVSPHTTKRKDNIAFNGKHSGETCYILGTGPSVSSIDLSALSGKLCIGVGEFFNHSQYTSFPPRYYVQAPNHHPFGFDYASELINGVKPSRDVTNLFLGINNYRYSYQNCLDAQRYPGCVHFIDYQFSIDLHESNYTSHSQWDISSVPFSCRTVICMAIQLAFYMGCSRIVLLGCEHDYIRRFINGEDFSNHHFYDESVSPTEGVTSFLSAISLKEWFANYWYKWHDFELIHRFAILNGIEIINSTPNSILDIFPRAPLASLL